MKTLFRVAVLMGLAMPVFATGHAREKIRPGVIYGDSVATVTGISQDLQGRDGSHHHG